VVVGFREIEEALRARPARTVEEPVRSRAAVAAILRTAAAGLELLFIRRAEHERDPWSGQIGFPGGRFEPGDRDLRATAARETLEEIGLDLATEATPLGDLDQIRAMARGRPVDLAISPFVYRLDREPEIRLSSEVRDVHWIALDDLVRAEHQGRFQYRHEDQTIELPCLRIGEVVIWGLTYRMFMGLRERIEERLAILG
jgi:8-oxo-dGTP pyrophosphatase MutT (NUDIX family)